MPALTHSSLATRFSLSVNPHYLKGYYRSKLFITASTSNPLIAAASPLFSLLERLGISPTLPPIENIRSSIEHELHAFQSRLARREYPKEFSTIALYLIEATIDELLGKNYLRLHGKAPEFKAFTPVTHNEKGPETIFFEMIEQLKEKESQYLDLIELAYYCLISGFEGELHVHAAGRQTLENLIEELYQLICKHRVHKPTTLFKNTNPIIPKKSTSKTIITVTLLGLGMLISLGILSHTLIEHKAATLFNAYSR